MTDWWQMWQSDGAKRERDFGDKKQNNNNKKRIEKTQNNGGTFVPR